MKKVDIESAAEQLATVMTYVESGSLSATPEQVAYMSGALEALRSLQDH